MVLQEALGYTGDEEAAGAPSGMGMGPQGHPDIHKTEDLSGSPAPAEAEEDPAASDISRRTSVPAPVVLTESTRFDIPVSVVHNETPPRQPDVSSADATATEHTARF